MVPLGPDTRDQLDAFLVEKTDLSENYSDSGSLFQEWL
jgi:hypothetical protein